MKEAIIIFLFALVIGAAMNGFTGPTAPSPQQGSPNSTSTGSQTDSAGNPNDTSANALPSLGASGSSTGSALEELAQADFDAKVLKSDKPVFVDFWAPWCGPCREMLPVVTKIATQYQGKVNFYRVDIDSNEALCAKYNVTSIPTFIIFKGGKRVDSYTGAMGGEILTAALDKQTTP